MILTEFLTAFFSDFVAPYFLAIIAIVIVLRLFKKTSQQV